MIIPHMITYPEIKRLKNDCGWLIMVSKYNIKKEILDPKIKKKY